MINRFKNIYLALLSTIFVSITNIPYYFAAYSQNDLSDFMLTIAINLLAGLLLFSFILISKYLYFIANFIVLALNSGGAYFKAVYSIALSREAVESIFHANIQEIGSNFDHKIWIWGIVFAILPTIFLYKISHNFKFTVKNWFYTNIASLLLTLCFAILASNIAWHIKFYEKSLKGFMPFNYTVSLVQYLKSRQIIHSPKENSFITEKSKHSSLKFIVVIGESARSDHLSINGYERQTTPLLSKINNLISYKDAYALATYTIGGVQSIFKRDPSKSHYSLIKLMEQNGFKTFWFSNHRFENDIVTSIALEAQTHLFRDRMLADNPGINHDEVLIPYLKQSIAQSSDDNIFIVLHSLGSHYSYDLRYPEQFMNFVPTCKEEHSFFGREHCNDIVKTVNAYDNSILYTDFFLAKIIETLKDDNAIVIYISDHGESLGENGIFFHTTSYSTAPREQLHIPILFWASDKFLKHPENNQKFNKALAKENDKITQHNIFHSILHCIGFEMNIDKKLSICN